MMLQRWKRCLKHYEQKTAVNESLECKREEEKKMLGALCGLLCAQPESQEEHVTEYSCRRGPYLPTVPELTHMPLCWWFSRSLKPDKDARRGKMRSLRSRCLPKSTNNCRQDLCPITSSSLVYFPSLPP